MLTDKTAYFCRICGNLDDHPVWGADGQSPSFNICNCCGVEYGYEDCNLQAVRSYRTKWLEKGAQWLDPKKQPPNWSLEEQMKNIPEQYR